MFLDYKNIVPHTPNLITQLFTPNTNFLLHSHINFKFHYSTLLNKAPQIRLNDFQLLGLQHILNPQVWGSVRVLI